MDVQGIGHSDVGLVRQNNEDAVLVDAELGLFAVCDGMGGAAGGEVAAKMAITSIERAVREQGDAISRVRHDPAHSGDLGALLEAATHRACQEIHTRAAAEPALAGMGCTATVLVTAGRRAAMAHVGDSRLYVVRNGKTHQLSSDHTLAAELVRTGTIEPDQERGHSQAHILTRALGIHASVDVETLSFDLLPGDRLLLCSDGLSDYIPSPAWLAERFSRSSIEETLDDLIDFALGCGGRDNITAVAIQVEGEDEDPTQPHLSTERLLGVLGSSFLFSDLSLAQLSRLLDRSEIRTFNAEDIIYGLGDVQNELLVVITGTIRVESLKGERGAVGPGQHLGEALVLRPRPIRAKIVAEEPTTLLAINGSSLVELVNRRPWLGVILLTRLVERLSGDLDRRSPVEPGRRALVPGDLL